METLKMSTALRQIKDGKFECLQDIKIGYVEIRTAAKKSEPLK